MSYALAAAPTAPALSPAVTAAIATLAAEPCWSADLHNCVETALPSTLPECPKLRAAYASATAAERAALDAAVEAVPFCPAPKTDWMLTLGAGAIGLALGIAVASVIR